MENNAAINPVAGTLGVIYWTQMKKPITSDRLKLKNGSGEWTGYHFKPFELKSTSKISFTLPFVYQMCTTWYHKLVIIYPCLSPIQPRAFNFFPLFFS